MSTSIYSFDLTKRAPRSPRIKLGGYVILPRMLDKGRAFINGVNGEYNFVCPLDNRFIEFTGIDPDQLKEELAKGKGDFEMLQWIREHASKKHTPWEINQWSAYQETRPVSDKTSREFFNKYANSISEERDDIACWFDLLDMDDYASFGGKP